MLKKESADHRQALDDPPILLFAHLSFLAELVEFLICVRR